MFQHVTMQQPCAGIVGDKGDVCAVAGRDQRGVAQWAPGRRLRPACENDARADASRAASACRLLC